MTAEVVFWFCIALVAYAYAGYPLLVAALARRYGQVPHEADTGAALTVVIAAFDEEARIAARVRDVLDQDYPIDRLQVLVVSDGSRDGTAQAAAIDDERVRVLALPVNVGKAMAINAAMRHVDTALVAFTDVRQRFAPGTLRSLVAPFADPSVGSVSGELVIGAATGSSEGVGLYWRMEKRLRADEARLGWLHGVSGSIHAMRSAFFRPMPPGTVLDDMWMPLQSVFSGHQVWMAREAIAIDRASASIDEEFQRKLRTLAGNWQLIARMPALLNPLRNPAFFAWFSHKFLRLLVPWALLVALAASAFADGALYRLLFFAQLLAYGGALAGLALPRVAARMPLLPAASSFVILNFAALLSLPASLAMDPSRLWKKH
ncbi:glycosyltransferase family 2 protein [Lysobacter sp. LF1]|uniref:Glycosyltransferase family 2 protein n=1 Tax=Lysobacter stagni TaxID=3045172 RepID=A0ABT6XJY4_9GAMM|nr:glycosyltransferase family 2 protein [Lysobacter sp. LF1]MDI9240379.1 glycosyltransferase family 2 protein [Lysobacter sp. LF1]